MIRLFTFMAMFSALSFFAGIFYMLEGKSFFEMNALILTTRTGIALLLIYYFKDRLKRNKLW